MSAKEGVFVPYRDAQACPIAFDEHTYWFLLSDSSSGFHSCQENIAQVLALVRREFISIFGTETVAAHPSLMVCYRGDEDPETFRQQNLIYLSSCDPTYLQHIYQFSHELCHFMVPTEVCDPYRWFEETLCQAMSWYILQRIYDMGRTNPLPWLNEFCIINPAYITNSQRKRKPLEPAPLSAFVSRNFPYLQVQCYDREMNRAIAYEIYPLLEQYPSLWLIVPHLAKLRADMDLSSAILFLLQEAGVEEPGGHQLLQRLCQ